MIGERLEIRGTLLVLSPLQIGNGNKREIDRGNNETSSIRTIDCDDYGAPFVPGSSLKGVLRELMKGHPALQAMFGPDHIEKATDASSGRIIFRNAWLKEPPPEKARKGVADRTLQGLHKAIYTEAHVGKDVDAGVAAKAKLFHDDAVLPGTTFTLSLALLDQDRTMVRALLGWLSQESGVAFGMNSRQGLGRLRLLPETVVCHQMPGYRTENIILISPDVTKPDYQLSLVSPVPFLIHDPHRALPRTHGETERSNTQLALQGFDGTGGRLTGSTLIGALSAAFADFAKRNKAADAVERLFGSVDQRGRVCIEHLAATAVGKGKTITSVKLDRFSGAPIDNALFATEGFFGTAFDLDLRLENRLSLSADVQTADDKLFDAFVTELKSDLWGGLMLGHGSSRGFGWFSVKERVK